MTIESSIRNKVIEMHKNGKTRDAIAHELNLTGIRISTGSVSNILKDWRQRESQRSEAPNVREQPESTDRVTTFPEEVLGEVEFKKNPDISIENHTITNTQDFEKNGYVVEDGQKGLGAPLNWFTNGFETKSEDSQHQSSVLTDLLPVNSGSDKSLPQSPPSTFVKTIVATQPPQQQNVVAIEDFREPDDLCLDKVELEAIQDTTRGTQIIEKSFAKKPETIEKKPVSEPEVNRMVPSDPEATRPRPRPRHKYIEALEQEHFSQERKAWEYYGHAQDLMLNQMKKEKYQRTHERLVLDRREKKLDEWTKRLEQRESNLKDRETSLRNIVTEAEPFLAVVKELENLGVGMNEVIPWIETIREKAKMEKIDHKKAAAVIAQELGFYRQCGGIQKQIERANQELTLIEMSTIQKKQVITVLRDLINRGVTEPQILQLINFAGEWNKYWQSSTTASGVAINGNGNLQRPVATNGNGNLQQPGSNNPGSNNGGNDNNGYGDNFSINDLIRLNLLKSTTTNMLNRMGV